MLLLRGGPILLLLMCPWGNIYWRFKLPCEVGVILPIGIIGVAIVGISWWPILAHNICIFQPSNPLLREKLDNVLLDDW